MRSVFFSFFLVFCSGCETDVVGVTFNKAETYFLAKLLFIAFNLSHATLKTAMALWEILHLWHSTSCIFVMRKHFGLILIYDDILHIVRDRIFFYGAIDHLQIFLLNTKLPSLTEVTWIKTQIFSYGCTKL